jgi:mono/diheme cytochrome c family protein
MRKRTKEGIETILLLGLASLAAALPFTQSSVRVASWQQESGTVRTDRISRGELAYRVHCASCHGSGGQGNGAMADHLKVEPTDLTRLSRDNQGVFPAERVYGAIDGRREVRGHGPSSMPVWGLTFQMAGRDSDQEQEVRERILDLMSYLESIQEK